MLRDITTEELEKIVNEHNLWLNSNRKKGKCAVLYNINLGGCDLSNVNLSYSIICRSSLVRANLTNTNFYNANLTRTDFYHANLYHANLSGAILRYSDLRYADLNKAILYFTNLSYADITHTNINMADSLHINLKGTKLDLPFNGSGMDIDKHQAINLLYWLLINVKFSENIHSKKIRHSFLTKDLIDLANNSEYASLYENIEYLQGE